MKDIPKAYDPNDFESKWYQKWLDDGDFTANVNSSKPPFSIVIPPPNVTGVLHMGHVLNNTIQDILARRARMNGFEVLWLPGTDHAGIATQVVVERNLKKEKGCNRHEIGRDAFVKKVWQWKEKHGDIIVKQLQKLGCSCDWSRMSFTMDPTYSKKVAQTFVDLFQKGHIYRGRRMVNWCPISHTALSDEEVIMKEQRGWLYYFRVEIIEEPGSFLSIATTRPETIPGDSGIAVHPNDPRYAKYIGKHVRRPIPREFSESEKSIPIIADERVDHDFGTGVLKITPAHDKADFEIGERHSLKIIEVIDEAGKMSVRAGKDLFGRDRSEARKIASRLLDEMGLLEKKEAYTNKIGFSERAEVPIEPRISDQWFMKYPSAKRAREVVDSGKIRFYPDRWKKVYDHWMENLQDWCISRQLWWGHRIPVWKKGSEIKCQTNSPGADWQQDPDVLDTWCSSWLWPFATMDDEMCRKFYPTSVLVTAPEILFFWVARMIMAGLEYQDQIPFKAVVLHGIVRDRQGRKMAKSMGNSPDPLHLISQYGADALRFGIMRSTPRGQDTLFDEQNVKLGRNFCNKLWNACRFRQMHGGLSKGDSEELNKDMITSDDQWILYKLASAVDEIGVAFEEYKLNEATQVLYRFFWSEYCDWYLEASKAILQGKDARQKATTLAVIDFILNHSLRLMHPFLPFITEELWHGMGFASQSSNGKSSIMNASFPKKVSRAFEDRFGLSSQVLDFVKKKHNLVKAGRNLKVEAGIPSNKKVPFILKPFPEITIEEHDHKGLEILLGAVRLDIDATFTSQKGAPNALSAFGELHLLLETSAEVRASMSFVKRHLSEIEKIEKELDKVNMKMSNPSFIAKAPAAVVEKHRRRLRELREKKAHAQRNLDVAKAALA